MHLCSSILLPYMKRKNSLSHVHENRCFCLSQDKLHEIVSENNSAVEETVRVTTTRVREKDQHYYIRAVFPIDLKQAAKQSQTGTD